MNPFIANNAELRSKLLPWLSLEEMVILSNVSKALKKIIDSDPKWESIAKQLRTPPSKESARNRVTKRLQANKITLRSIFPLFLKSIPPLKDIFAANDFVGKTAMKYTGTIVKNFKSFLRNNELRVKDHNEIAAYEMLISRNLLVDLKKIDDDWHNLLQSFQSVIQWKKLPEPRHLQIYQIVVDKFKAAPNFSQREKDIILDSNSYIEDGSTEVIYSRPRLVPIPFLEILIKAGLKVTGEISKAMKPS